MLSANARREAYRAEVVPWPAKPLKYLMEQNVKSPYLATFAPEREQPQQTACCHSITSSTWASNVGEIVWPSAFAVFILSVTSNFVGCSMGRSAGVAPLRILFT